MPTRPGGMRKRFPRMAACLSVLCTVGCSGSSTTRVTPTSTAPPGGSDAATPGSGSGSPTPSAPPSPSPSPPPGPSPAPTGDFAWTVETSGRGEPLSAVWGSGAGDVWAVGGHGVVHSTGDGGWTTVHAEPGDEYQALLGDDGWLFVGGTVCANGVCQGGLLLRSSDGGATWARQPLGAGITGFAAAAGAVYADSAALYRSPDHFASSAELPLDWATSTGLFADGGALYAYGGLRGAEIRRSSDGGQSWATVYAGFSGSQSGTMSGLARGDQALFALADGCSVPACVGAVLRSEDDGASWQEASRPQDWVAGIWALSAGELYVGGTALMRSVDGGATFTKVTLPVDQAIMAIWGASANEIYAVGQDGIILHGRR